jgi:hypothetical protein
VAVFGAEGVGAGAGAGRGAKAGGSAGAWTVASADAVLSSFVPEHALIVKTMRSNGIVFQTLMTDFSFSLTRTPQHGAFHSGSIRTDC